MAMLLLALATWIAVVLAFAAPLARAVPRNAREHVFHGGSGRLVIGLLTALPLVAGYAAGGAVADPDDPATSPVVAGIVFAILFGGIAAAANWRWWRAGRSLVTQDRALPVPPLPRPSEGVPAWEVSDDASLPVPVVDRNAHRPDRALRRLRTGAAALAVLALWAARLARLEGNGTPVALAALVVGAALVAGGAHLVLRARRPRGSSDDELEALAARHGWAFTAVDGDRLPGRFPGAPLPAGFRDAVPLRRRTVDARTGDRHWWATEQRGEVRVGGRHRTVHRSVWLVWLPAVQLPPVLVAGRDLVGVLDWFGPSVEIELESFNRTVYARTTAGDERTAVAVLHPRMVEHLQSGLGDGTSLLLAGDFLCVWRDGPLVAHELPGTAAFALRAAALLPRYLLREAAPAAASAYTGRRTSLRRRS